MQQVMKHLEKAGFKQTNTGGGCMAMRYAPRDGSWEILVTEPEGAGLPEDDSWLVCGYGADLGETVFAIDQDGSEGVSHAVMDAMTAIYKQWCERHKYERKSVDELIAELWARMAIWSKPNERTDELSKELAWLRAFNEDWERVNF